MPTEIDMWIPQQNVFIMYKEEKHLLKIAKIKSKIKQLNHHVIISDTV